MSLWDKPPSKYEALLSKCSLATLYMEPVISDRSSLCLHALFHAAPQPKKFFMNLIIYFAFILYSFCMLDEFNLRGKVEGSFILYLPTPGQDQQRPQSPENPSIQN